MLFLVRVSPTEESEVRGEVRIVRYVETVEIFGGERLRSGLKILMPQGHVNGPYANHGLIITRAMSHYRR